MKIYEEAKCLKAILHEFETSRDLSDALIEICIRCSEKRIYKKVGGRIDNAKQLRSHLRDTLQPFGRTGKLFEQTYGRYKPRFAWRRQDNRTEEEMMRDARKDFRRMNEEGKIRYF